MFLLVLDAPSDPPSKLLQEYLSIRTDHPNNGTAEAANFWKREARFLDLKTAIWSLDRSGKCTHFITRVPATIESSGRPIMLLHHGDTVPAEDSEWTHPPFKPAWVRNTYDWELYGRGAIDDKGPGVVHWMALKNILEKPRSRDLYFVMNCGEEVSDQNGAQAFVNFLIRPIPGLTRELSTVEKLELAAVIGEFPSLPNLEWIWNEGSFGEKTQIAPNILLPIATSQKGYWLGQISVSGKSGHGALSTKVTALEAVVAGVQRLYEKNRSFGEKFRSLHTEMESLVSAVSKTLPFWKRILLYIYPRLFFEVSGLQSLVTSWWVPSRIQTNSTLPNVIASEASVVVEYRFLGEKEIPEIERDLKRAFESKDGQELQVKVQTQSFIPFRRDFFRGSEAEIFSRVLSSYPNVVVSPFITPGITDSRYFRWAGVRAFDFVPFFLSKDEIRGMHGRDEKIPHLELLRAIEIETAILEKLLQ